MSLYAVQKLLYQLNRDPALRDRFNTDMDAVLAAYDLDDEERGAIRRPDLGLLYVLGVNGQILVHYASLHGIAWPDYLDALRQGLLDHGPVREGVYAETGYEGVEAHTQSILARRDRRGGGE